MTMLRDLMPSIAKPEDPIWTTTIMTYELGSLVRALVRRQMRFYQTNDLALSNSYLATVRIELADLMTQCRVLAEQMGWKWIDLENDGLERFKERMKEIKDGTI